MHLYCELPFLAYLFQYADKSSFSTNENERLRDDFFQCMQQKTTTTVVNTDVEAVAENPFLRKMLDSAQQGKGKLTFKKDCFDEINTTSFYENPPFSKIISTTKTDVECTKLTTKYATPFLNTTNFYKNWKNYSERHYANTGKKSQAITEKYLENKTWRELLPNNIPTANIVIEDPYLLDNEKGIFNLVEILKVILPKPSPVQTLHIDIFTDDNNGKFTPSLQNKLNDSINTHFGANYNLIVYLQMPSSVRSLHDRRIYTNYYRLNSGNSFAYFKQNRNNTVSGDRKDAPTLDLFLYSNQNNVVTTEDLLQILKKISENPAQKIELHLKIPTKCNSLLF